MTENNVLPESAPVRLYLQVDASGSHFDCFKNKWMRLTWNKGWIAGQEVSYVRNDFVEWLKEKLKRVEALEQELIGMQIKANLKEDSSETPGNREWLCGYSEAIDDCLQKLRAALGEKRHSK